MVQINNLRYLLYENGRISVEARKPPGVCLAMATQDWLYRGGCFRIGSGVRADGDNNLLPGILFVFNWANVQQRRKSAVIIHDVEKYGRLVNA